LLNPYFKLMALGFCFLTLVSVSPDNSQVSRAEFVAMIAENQPDHPFLPKNHTELSQDELFAKTARILRIRGFKVLSGKDAKGVMTEQEFVRVAYALSGEPPGKSLFEQKLFLKKQGPEEYGGAGGNYLFIELRHSCTIHIAGQVPGDWHSRGDCRLYGR